MRGISSKLVGFALRELQIDSTDRSRLPISSWAVAMSATIGGSASASREAEVTVPMTRTATSRPRTDNETESPGSNPELCRERDRQENGARLRDQAREIRTAAGDVAREAPNASLLEWVDPEQRIAHADPSDDPDLKLHDRSRPDSAPCDEVAIDRLVELVAHRKQAMRRLSAYHSCRQLERTCCAVVREIDADVHRDAEADPGDPEHELPRMPQSQSVPKRVAGAGSRPRLLDE